MLTLTWYLNFVKYKKITSKTQTMVTLNVFQNVVTSLAIIFGLCVLVCTILVTQISKCPKWLLWVITLPLEAEFILFALKGFGVEIAFLLHKINIYAFLAMFVIWLVMTVRALESEEKKKRAWILSSPYFCCNYLSLISSLFQIF